MVSHKSTNITELIANKIIVLKAKIKKNHYIYLQIFKLMGVYHLMYRHRI